jgi:anti-sigma factor RsiW
MDERILKLLYRSLDSPLKKKEEERLNRALAQSAELRKRRDEILAMRRALVEGSVRAFRPGFAERVLRRVRADAGPGDRSEALARAYAAAFKRIAIAGLIVLAVLVSYNLVKGDLLPGDAIFYASNLAVGKLLQVPVF